MIFILYFPLALILIFIFHEGGHYLTARIFGKKIRFKFSTGKLWKVKVPRYIWFMPDIDLWKQKIIAIAGFSFEFFLGICVSLIFKNFGLVYLFLAGVHILTYNIYAGEANDFKWFKK